MYCEKVNEKINLGSSKSEKKVNYSCLSFVLSYCYREIFISY